MQYCGSSLHKAWYEECSRILRSLGWEPSVESPGLWRKPSKQVPGRFLKKSVYVDDNLITGPNKNELKQELEAIFEKMPGKIIPAVVSKDAEGFEWEFFDFLGADCHYSQQRKSMKITMSTYIKNRIRQASNTNAK